MNTSATNPDDATASPIFLIGYRGTGKSTVAHLLAKSLDFDCADADELIVQRAGKTIAEIFDDGESAFRDAEAEVVAQLCERRQTVVSLGGGAVMREASRAAIRAAGPVVWLKADVDTIVERLAADPTTAASRPNLTSAGGRDEIETVLAQRTPIYGACASCQIDTEEKSPTEIVAEIVEQLKSLPSSDQ